MPKKTGRRLGGEGLLDQDKIFWYCPNCSAYATGTDFMKRAPGVKCLCGDPLTNYKLPKEWTDEKKHTV